MRHLEWLGLVGVVAASCGTPHREFAVALPADGGAPGESNEDDISRTVPDAAGADSGRSSAGNGGAMNDEPGGPESDAEPGAQLNACGGTKPLAGNLGDDCGECGKLVCDGKEAVACDDLGKNACGGCSVLNGKLKAACGACGVLTCNGENALKCDDPGYAKPVDVVAGGGHSCALMSTGTVRCWGDNAKGQLAVAANSSATATPPVGVELVKAIAAGEEHTCALLNNGTVECWGSNSMGQLGDGTRKDRSTPSVIPMLTGVTSIFAQGAQSCAIRNGMAYCWGWDTWNQLNDIVSLNALPPCRGDTCYKASPVAVTAAISITMNADFSCVARDDNGLRCWGDPFSGQTLGNTSLRLPGSNQASDVVAVASGIDPGPSSDTPGHACALTKTGGVRCWGACFQGECGPGAGIGDVSVYPTTDIVTEAASIAVGTVTVCARLTSGKVKCWGSGSHDVREISGISGATALAAGEKHQCVVVPSGVLCWGDNAHAQLGDPSAGPSSATPVSVKGLSEVCN